MPISAHSQRLLMLAFACRPDAGSEPGLGWNRALQAAKYIPTWVLCDEQENWAPVERYIRENGPIKNLQFVYVPPSRTEQQLRRISGLYYLSYNLWHRRAYRIAKELHSQFQFDVVHQLNLCGFREPGYLWKLDVPFVWGPIGGAQNYPWRFIPHAGIAGAVSESIRNVLNVCQVKLSYRVGRAARKAAAMMAANSTNSRELASRRGEAPRVMVETGVHSLSNPPERKFQPGEPLRILWSGVLEHRKALHLLLAALAVLPSHVQYELRILGRGPLLKRWQRIAKKLKVDAHCQWIGWLERSQVFAQYQWADVFAFSSLRDTTGNVVLESFASGTPVLCFDHQGMADIVTEECGVKLPVSTPAKAIAGLRDTLLRWHDHRDELEHLSRGAVARAKYYDWQRQGERMAEVYREVLKLDPSVVAVNGSIEDHQYADAATAPLALATTAVRSQ